jgi:Rrf2 family transcriptional regulator, nitric oxide-sensitive transcriptional repressor
MLAHAPETITIGAVFREFEAVLPFTECFMGDDCTCPLVAACRLKGVLTDALGAFYAELDRHSIADLVQGNEALKSLLQVA